MVDETQENGGWQEMLLGSAIIVAILAGLGYGAYKIYNQLSPPVPAVISLSAYFVDDTGAPVLPASPDSFKAHLKIKGDVSQRGELVKSGNVRITVSSPGNGLFQQSVYIPFQNGHFETEDPAFRSIKLGEPVAIKAELTAPGIEGTAAIYLNHQRPVESAISTTMIEWVASAVGLLFVIVFFVAFTGKKTAFKNRVAIIFSYLVIAMFLAVPIVAPTILLQVFPGAAAAMVGEPAGLVNTHTPDQPGQGTQWALNIGGYSYLASQTPGSASDPQAPQKPSNQNSVTSPPNSASTAGASPSPVQPVLANAPRTFPTTAPATPPAQPASDATGSWSVNVPPIVKVEGGLLIPLYVIILSVIGGAINMTRKVPGFQKEGEESDFNLARPIAAVGTAVISRIRPSQASSDTASSAATGKAMVSQTQKVDQSLEEQAQAIDDQLAPLVTIQLQRNSETDATVADIRNLVSKMQDTFKARQSGEPLLKFNSFEDWAASHPRLREILRGGWRMELLNQYMYLISAPFLAIVTYYILDLLGLSKQGVVVVLSFSVGLVSERIVSWILGIATGYLRTDTGNTGPKPS